MMMAPSIFVGQLMEDPPPFSSGMHCTNLLSLCTPRYYYYDISVCIVVVVGSIISGFFLPLFFASHLGRRGTFHDLGMLAETHNTKKKEKKRGEKREKSLYVKSCERDGVFSFSPLYLLIPSSPSLFSSLFSKKEDLPSENWEREASEGG